jgi:endonuclease/exonuclease/phosphatase family metal-dependent hydrolase
MTTQPSSLPPSRAPAPGPAPQESRPPGSLRTLTYNVRRCYGLDGVYAPTRIAEVIAESGAEIVALQELDVNRKRSGNVDQAMAIASALSMNVFFHPALQVVDELYGDAVLSSLPIRLVKAGALPRSWAPRSETRGALWVEIVLGGTRVQIVNTHFGLGVRERTAQADTLLGPEWIGHADCRKPLIALGDFNSIPLSFAYRRLASRLKDAQRLTPGRPERTFPAARPLLRIDHVFVSDDVEVVSAGVVKSAKACVASDHLPLRVDLRVPLS